MPLGLGGRPIATVTGSAIKETPCERCGHTYFYLLTRSLRGYTGRSPVFTRPFEAALDT
jgi:hypothetical protein